MLSKSGRGVTLSTSDQLIQSLDVAVNATTFLVTGCLAWNTVAADLRPRCVSLMDANRADWYVRHSSSYLRADPQYDSQDLPLFQQESSFIVYAGSFYQGYYALESINVPDNYIRLRDDGYLWIEPDAYNAAFTYAVSFAIYRRDNSRKHSLIVYQCTG